MSKAGVVTSGAAGFAGSSTTGCAAGTLSAGVDGASRAGARASTSGVSCLLSSLADTAPFPKNMNRAATATLAAPKLYLRIE